MNYNGWDSEKDMKRPRLDRILGAAVAAGPVVVYAGGGFGKSQAVAGLLGRSVFCNVWLSFTHLDNIPSRFWEHFVTAVRQHKAELGMRMEKIGFPETLQAFDNFLSEFTAELYQDQSFVVFVFDNLQLITEPLVKNLLTGLVDAQLENSSIILITREWPLRGMNLMVTPRIIGIRELRYTAEETYALLNRDGEFWSRQEAEEIWHYVMGWPIAISIAAFYLRQHHEQVEKLHFSGSKPLLFQVFEMEIFSQYTEKEQELLIILSVLESLPRGLVVAVTGEKHRDLQPLLADNIFIKYDAETERFYFHPLYQEFLHEKLEDMQADDVNAAYQKAADWCQAQGFYYDAINYYHCCNNAQGIWESIQMTEAGRRSKSEAEFFIRELEELPEELKEREPMIAIMRSVLLLNNLRFSEARQVIEDVQKKLEEGPDSEENRSLLGECYTAKGLITLAEEKTEFEEYFQQAAALLPRGSRRWGRSLRIIDFGPGLNLRSKDPGAMAESVACFSRAVPYITKVLHGAGQGLDHLCCAEALFLTGEVKASIQPAYQALYAATGMEQFDVVGSALYILLRAYAAMGDHKNINDVFEHVTRYENDKNSADLGIWDIIRSWYYTKMGEYDKVTGWIRNAVQNGYPPISIERPLLARLSCLIAGGQTAEALALLEQFEHMVRSKHAVIALIYVELARALLHHQAGHQEPSFGALEQAYELAKGNDIIMPFVEQGSRMRTLLERVQSTKQSAIPDEWLDRIHAKASTYAKRHAYLQACYKKDQGNISPGFELSKREQELLSHLSQGLTREEIGSSMELSMNTVKSMLKQIFSKMGAVNSADAVRIALMNKLI